jgi:hypothetical protein
MKKKGIKFNSVNYVLAERAVRFYEAKDSGRV